MTDSPNASQNTHLGPYSVIGAIAGGSGWGELVRAMDEEQQRYVSILMIPPERLAPPGAGERLAQIAQALFRLDHQNTVRYYNIVTGDEQPYIVKEYCDDTSLQTLITHGDLPPMPVLADFLAQACRGLHAGWLLSLAHGALTPAKLALSSSGAIKVNELGLIQAFCGPKDPAASIEALPGFAPYAAPERAAGQRPEWQADLFSLGAIFYHVLAGRPPFGENPNSDTRLAPATPLTSMNNDTPPELWRVIKRMMEPDPTLRFASFTEAKLALKAAGAGILNRASGEPADNREMLGAAAGHAAVDEPATMSAPLEPLEQTERSPLARHSISEYMDNSRVELPEPTTHRKAGARPHMIMIVATFLICIAVALAIWGKSAGPSNKSTVSGFLHSAISTLFGGKRTAEKDRLEKRSMTRDNMLFIEAVTQEYFIEQHRYPDSVQDLIEEGYMGQEDTIDGWGNEFLCSLSQRIIRSFGEDGEEDTADDYVLVEGVFTQQPAKEDTELLDEDF